MFRLFSSYFDAQERRLVFQSIIVGVVVWLVVFTLKTAVHDLSHFVLRFIEEQPYYFILLLVPGSLAAGALIVALIARTAGTIVHYRDDSGHIHELIDVEGDGLERAISLYFASEPTFEQTLLGTEGVDVRWKMPTLTLAARKFVATLATIGSGGSGGLEASVTLIGESLAAGIFKPRQPLGGRFSNFFSGWRPSDPDDLQTAQLSGIAAAVSTLIGAPITAAFFATEVMYRKRPIIEKLVYSLVAALVAFFLNTIAPPLINQTGLIEVSSSSLFKINEVPTPPLTDVPYYILILILSVLTALVAVQFGRLRKWVDDWFHHYQKNVWIRHLSGAMITAGIALAAVALVFFAGEAELFGLHSGESAHALELVLGTGESVINDALNGELVLAIAILALIAKIFATLATIGSGGSAGLLIPSLFYGTMIATIVVYLPQVFGLPWAYEPIHLIAPAMAASLVAIVNVPIASILFVVEIFGRAYIAPALVALVATNILAHNNSIYRTQRERYEQRQILPGYSVRRIPVPQKWRHESLLSLDLRQRFDVNAIGWLEQEGDDGLPHVRLSADAARPLNMGDILVVIGTDGAIDKLEQHIKLPAAAEKIAEEEMVSTPLVEPEIELEIEPIDETLATEEPAISSIITEEQPIVDEELTLPEPENKQESEFIEKTLSDLNKEVEETPPETEQLDEERQDTDAEEPQNDT
ncbi:MAG: chloride channel protein [Chloroflexota bacterium]